MRDHEEGQTPPLPAHAAHESRSPAASRGEGLGAEFRITPNKRGPSLAGADRVIAEKNQGGDMVASVLTSADVSLPVKLVSASRGKVARAEPVAALFENGRAKLSGRFPELEDELAALLIGGDYGGPGRSPDRADACVWAITALMKRSTDPRVNFL